MNRNNHHEKQPLNSRSETNRNNHQTPLSKSNKRKIRTKTTELQAKIQTVVVVQGGARWFKPTKKIPKSAVFKKISSFQAEKHMKHKNIIQSKPNLTATESPQPKLTATESQYVYVCVLECRA